MCRGTLAPCGPALFNALFKEEPDLPEDVTTALKNPDNDLGAFVLLRRIGRGGMGEVWRAWEKELRRYVAIKFILNASDEERHRLKREAQVAAKLEHPNIIPVYEVGESARGPFIVMKLIEGETLERAPLTFRQKLMAVRDAALALEYAHLQGVVHRDIKPQNILVQAAVPGTPTPWRKAPQAPRDSDEAPHIYVMDFGLAKQFAVETSLSVSGVIVGTPEFMAPEQARGKSSEVDPRTDVYALGATLYRLLTGVPPFWGETPLDVVQKVVHDDPVPPSRYLPRLSRDVQTMVLKCLEKEKARRYQSAGEFAEDLQRFLDGEPIRARPVSLAYRMLRKIRKHVAVVATIAGLLVTFAAALFLLVGLPAIRDHRLLKEAVANKIAEETRFVEMVRNQQYDRAIELGERLFGTRPPIPAGLSNPARAAGYPDLDTPYRIALAQAYLARASSGPKARGDLVSAYHTALLEGDDRTAREAALRLARLLAAEENREAALAILRAAESRFPSDPAVLEPLARALEQVGRLEEAAARWRELNREEYDALRTFLPRRSFAFPNGSLRSADLDGDGRDELVLASPAGTLTVYRWTPLGPQPAGTAVLQTHLDFANSNWTAHVLDADDDGRPEIVVSAGAPDLHRGALLVFTWNGRDLEFRSSDAVQSYATSLVKGDLDGDGVPELMVAMGYYQRSILVYRCRTGVLQRLFEVPTGCDPRLLDFRPNPDCPLVLHLGPWDRQWGWRLYVGSLDADRRFRPSAASPDQFELCEMLPLDGGTWILGIGRFPTAAKVQPGLARSGIYRVRVGDREISKLEPLTEYFEESPRDLTKFDVKGRSCVVFAVGTRLHVMPLDGTSPRRVFELGEGFRETRVAAARLEGVRTQLVLHRPDALEVWGLGRAEEVAPVTSARLVSVGRGGAGQDLLDAKLYREAETVLRKDLSKSPNDARLLLSLGTALMGQGRYREAAEVLKQAQTDRLLSVEAGLRRAEAMQAARDWRGLVEALEDLEARGLSDPYAERQVREWKQWALPASRLRSASVVRAWKPGLPLLCENPFEARATEEGLETWQSSSRRWATGVAVHLGGGPVRFRIRARVFKPDWGVSATLGISVIDGAGQPLAYGLNRTGPTMILEYSCCGASDHPIYDLSWRGWSRDGLQASHGLPTDRYHLPEDADVELETEYIPGLDRAFVSLKGPAGADIFPPLEVRVPFRLERACYLLGQWAPAAQGSTTDERYRCRVILREMELFGGDGATQVLRPQAANAREHLLLANGDLVLGDLESARREFDAAVEAASREGDRYTLWRAHLFRALLHLRQGERDKARQDLLEALREQGNEAIALIRAASCLTRGEREFLTKLAEEF